LDLSPLDLTPLLVNSFDPSLLDITPLLREGRYLKVEIDLLRSIGQIEAEIRNEVESFQAEIHRSPKFEAGCRILKANLYLTNVQFGVMWYNNLVAGKFDERGMGE
jgi:hypothetical protein